MSIRLHLLTALPPLLLAFSPSSAEPAPPRLSHRPPPEVAPDFVLNRLTFGSCCKQNQPAPVLELIAAREADLFLWLGDNVYADTVDMEAMRKAYATLRNKPGYRKLMAASPVIGVWDDHDYGADDAGATYPKKDDSESIFLDWFDIPADAQRRKDPGIYGSHELGPPEKRVQVLLLDLRTWRTAQKRKKDKTYPNMGRYIPDRSPDATLLGEEQWAWLEIQLRRPARLRLLAMSSQFAVSDNGYERWGNYPAEQERLLNLIRKTKAEGVLFLAGDTHYAELNVREEPGLYPLFELTASAINQTWDPPAPSTHRLYPAYPFPNYGLVDIDWDEADPTIRLQVFNAEDTHVIDHTLPLSRLGFAKDNLTPSTPDDSFVRAWQSRFGPLTLAPGKDGTWSGTYRDGSLKLTRNGRTLTGTWSEGERSGPVTFTLTRDGQHLQGAYGRGDGPPLLAWPCWRE